jgi:hypothetical protein
MAVAFVRDHTGVSTKTSGTNNIGVNISTVTTPGNTLIARILFDNYSTTLKPEVLSTGGIAKPAGETNDWVRLGASRSPGVTLGAASSAEMWAIRTTVPWPVGSYTVTLDFAVPMKATDVREFSGVLATMRSTTGSSYSGTATVATATTTGTAPVIGDLAVGFIFGSNIAATPTGSNNTTGGTWSTASGIGSTGGSAATNNYGLAQYKILTAASHQTYTSSAAVATGNGVIVAILQQYVDPAITQEAYRFYADGTETASTALAAQDTTPTVDTSGGDVNAQLRVRLQATTSAAVDPWDDFQLQWEKNASGTWATPGSKLIEYTTAITPSKFSAGGLVGFFGGQTFMGNGQPLTGVEFKLGRFSTSDWTVSAVLFAHSGTLGAGGVGTGSALATSTGSLSSASVVVDPASDWYSLPFDGTFTLQSGVAYVIGLQTTAWTVGNYYMQTDNGGTAEGNRVQFNGTTWTPLSGDVLFRVSTVPQPVTVDTYDSPNLTDAAATTNRLTGGTGTFSPGKVSEDGLADDVAWAGNNYTELLYSLTFKAADLTAGDTLRFRVLRNGATTGLTYTSTPTVTIGGGGGGPVDKPIAGTVAGTSSTSGTIGMVSPPKDYPLAGTVAAATASSGNPAATHPLAGASTATTTSAGTIGSATPAQTYPLAGTVAATSTTTGSVERVALALPLAGTLSATSTVALGTIAAIHPLAGTAPATSATVGNPAAVHPVAGSVAGVSTATGTINMVGGPQAYPLAGVVVATSAVAVDGTYTDIYGDEYLGGLAVSRSLAGAAASTSAVAGAIGMVVGAQAYPLAGSVAAATASSGAPTATHPAGGVLAGASTSAGVLLAKLALAAAVAGIAATAGNPAAMHPLAGSADAASATSGTINLVGGPQVYPLAGLLPAVSSTSVEGVYTDIYGDTYQGGLTASHPLAGTPAATTTAGGAPAARHPLAAASSVTSATSGAINLITGPRAYPLAGVLAATSATVGDATAVYRLTGTLPALTATTGTVGVAGPQVYPLAGLVAAATGASGTPTAAYCVHGVLYISSTISGRLPEDVAATWLLRPPTVTYGTGGGRWSRLPRGVSLVVHGRSVRAEQTVRNSEWDTADHVYLGGHLYVVSADEAAVLTAAGYGSNLTPNL